MKKTTKQIDWKKEHRKMAELAEEAISLLDGYVDSEGAFREDVTELQEEFSELMSKLKG